MPLALDLISTLVMGSILPVATTLFARSPFSTLASLEGSILVPLLDAINTPVTTRARTPAAIELQMMIRLRRFFLPLPLPSTTASCLIPNLRTVIHLLLRDKHRNSSSKILYSACTYLDRRPTKKKAISSGYQYKGSLPIVPPASSKAADCAPEPLTPRTIIPLKC